MNWPKTLLFAFCAHASEQFPDVDMHAMTKEVMRLQRTLFSPEEFGAARNREEIRGALAGLTKHLGHLREKVFTDQPVLRTNVKLLSNLVAEADRSFRVGDKAFARYELMSSLQLCVACHTRTRSPDIVLAEGDFKGATEREKADFYFATRQFEAGKQIYEALLKTAKPADMLEIATPLLIFYSRVKEDPAGGEAFFSQQAANAQLPQAERRRFAAWAADFAAWRKEPKVAEVTLKIGRAHV